MGGWLGYFFFFLTIAGTFGLVRAHSPFSRFGIPQTITTDGGSVFISEEFRKFADGTGVAHLGR